MTQLRSRGALLIFAAVAVVFAQETAQFTSQSQLVLVPFNVVHEKLFVTDLKADDVVLLQDGKPRSFSVFEGPSTPHRVPIELILLFDTTTPLPPQPGRPRIATHWDRETTYATLTQNWDEKASEDILQFPGAEIRISIYRFDFNRLQRLCRSTNDPRVVRESFARLLTPMSDSDSTSFVTLDKRTDEGLRIGNVTFPYSASIAVLSDASKEPGSALRLMAVFSEGLAEPLAKAQELVDKANDTAIPLYPVVLDYDQYFQHPSAFGRSGAMGGAPIEGPGDQPGEAKHFNGVTPLIDRFAGVGVASGGASFSPSHLNIDEVRKILETVRNEGVSQYVVGFAPESTTASARSHKLEVRLKVKSEDKMINGRRETRY